MSKATTTRRPARAPKLDLETEALNLTPNRRMTRRSARVFEAQPHSEEKESEAAEKEVQAPKGESETPEVVSELNEGAETKSLNCEAGTETHSEGSTQDEPTKLPRGKRGRATSYAVSKRGTKSTRAAKSALIAEEGHGSEADVSHHERESEKDRDCGGELALEKNEGENEVKEGNESNAAVSRRGAAVKAAGSVEKDEALPRRRGLRSRTAESPENSAEEGAVDGPSENADASAGRKRRRGARGATAVEEKDAAPSGTPSTDTEKMETPVSTRNGRRSLRSKELLAAEDETNEPTVTAKGKRLMRSATTDSAPETVIAISWKAYFLFV